MPTERFGSTEKYRRWNAYRHLHGIKSSAKDVVVAGKKHKVKHSGKKMKK